MARAPRRFTVETGSSNHCTWRSHNREIVFREDAEAEKFLALLRENKVEHGVLIYSYCLMGTHPHVVTEAKGGAEAFSKFWQKVNGQYASWYNQRHGRRGQLVTDRYKSPRIQDERHLLRVMKYADRNPVKAGLAPGPSHWRWSSYRHYAFGEPNDLIDDAPAYLRLGATAVQRRIAYRNLCDEPLAQDQDTTEKLVTSLFIGDAEWIEERLVATGRRRRCHDPPAAKSTKG
jgi:putative transposase